MEGMLEVGCEPNNFTCNSLINGLTKVSKLGEV